MAAPRRRFLPYRGSLTLRAQALRHDPTPSERKLWYEFLCELPQKFTRQKPLGGYVVDFYCSSRRLIVELDGDSHFTNAARRYDAARSSALEDLGLRVIRFTNADVQQNFESVCLEILRALEPNADS